MEDLTRVILLGGLGPVRFGDSIDRVIATLGEPTSQGMDSISREEQWVVYYDPWYCCVHEKSGGGKPLVAVPAARLWAMFERDGQGRWGLESLESDSGLLRIGGIEICGASDDIVIDQLRKTGLAFNGYVPVSHEDWLLFSHGLILFSYDRVIIRMKWSADQEEVKRLGTFG